MPSRPTPCFIVLQTAAVGGGIRYKIEYPSEEGYESLHEPEDRVRAYLFVPAHTAEAKLPAILAIHQDGQQMNIGKLETAGLAGDKNLHYGLQLFQRGYVVLCTDRFFMQTAGEVQGCRPSTRIETSVCSTNEWGSYF